MGLYSFQRFNLYLIYHALFMVVTITLSLAARVGARTGGAASRLDFVNVGSPEETVLETYFVMLSKMNFDRAREQCVRIL